MLLLVFYVCALLSSICVQSTTGHLIQSERNHLGEVIQKRSDLAKSGSIPPPPQPQLETRVPRQYPLFNSIVNASHELEESLTLTHDEAIRSVYVLIRWAEALNLRRHSFVETVQVNSNVDQNGQVIYALIGWTRLANGGHDEVPVEDLARAEVAEPPAGWRPNSMYTVAQWIYDRLLPNPGTLDPDDVARDLEASVQMVTAELAVGLSYRLYRAPPEYVRGRRIIALDNLPDVVPAPDVVPSPEGESSSDSDPSSSSTPPIELLHESVFHEPEPDKCIPPPDDPEVVLPQDEAEPANSEELCPRNPASSRAFGIGNPLPPPSAGVPNGNRLLFLNWLTVEILRLAVTKEMNKVRPPRK
ncbi:MAG: hypothetical protein M1837_006439 [Sclerophora amabilis]|nr:MAG: hypothetical protein M1837_006439 [Sclerophora amabilis]